MAWIEMSLDTTHEAVDWVCTLLAGTSYTSDVRVQKYPESDVNGLAAQWAFNICWYIPYDANARACSHEIDNLLLPLHRTELTTAVDMTVVDSKAAQTTETSPLVRRIGNRFVVLSPEVAYSSQATDEVKLRLKTSLAFGSGLHPATILSLQLLEKYIVPKMNVLDLGSGSGILSVAAAKLGGQVLALDNDPVAVESTQDAVQRNHVESQVRVEEGSLGRGSDLGHWMGGDSIHNVSAIAPSASFDLIVANILARVHITLASEYRQALREKGMLIIAGFTSDYEPDVVASLQAQGFEVVDCDRTREWIALALRFK